MPPWIPGAITTVTISLATGYLGIVIAVRLNSQAMVELARRVTKLEDAKVDQAVLYALRDDLAHRIDTTVENVRSVGHRMNGIDQRITAVDDRVRGAA